MKSVRIWSFSGPYFLHSDRIRGVTPYLTVFSQNGGDTETVSFHKISTPGNYVKLRDFTQCFLRQKWIFDKSGAFSLKFLVTTRQISRNSIYI